VFRLYTCLIVLVSRGKFVPESLEVSAASSIAYVIGVHMHQCIGHFSDNYNNNINIFIAP